MRWLLCLPQLQGGSSARVRVWRRLHKLGAISIQGAVWVLPDVKPASDALEWFMHELTDTGTGAVLARAEWLDGLSEADLIGQFKQASTAEWNTFFSAVSDASPRRVAGLSRRAEEIAARDFFSKRGHVEASRLLAKLGTRPAKRRTRKAESYVARTWVTRRGIHVDRMASGWLIRRFIDPRARFRFVELSRYQPRDGDLRFDMQDGEFTHEGDRCTFEVLQHRFAPRDRALRRLGELVHDLDFDDHKFGRPEVSGFGQQLAAIAAAHPEDLTRLERASAVLDDLYLLGRKR